MHINCRACSMHNYLYSFDNHYLYSIYIVSNGFSILDHKPECSLENILELSQKYAHF